MTCLRCLLLVWAVVVMSILPTAPVGAEAGVVPEFQGIPLSCYVQVSEQFTEDANQAFSLSEIARKYIDAQDHDRAVELLDKAVGLILDGKENSPKAYLLLEIANHYAEAGQKQTAEATVGKAFTLIKGFANQVDRLFATTKVANAFVELGQNEKANRLLNQALQAAADIPDAYAKSRAYEAIASGLIKVGDLTNASTAITQGQEYAQMPPDPSARARALIEVAATYAEAKDHARASEYLKESLRIITPETPEQYRTDFNARALALIVERYLATDQPEQAQQVLSNIPDTSLEKSIGLLNLASRYRKDDQLDNAKGAIAESLSKISALPDSLDKSAILAEIAAGYRQLQDQDTAKTILATSGEVAQKLTVPTEKIYALTSIASQYADIGDNSTAEQYLDQSLATVNEANQIKKLTNGDRALGDIAGLYWRIGQTAKANSTSELMSPGLEQEQITSLFACASTKKQ